MLSQPLPTTRDRIIYAANHLFYGEGIRAVSVDAIAERAGVTKKTLYYHFKSKDDLIAAYLTSRDQPNLALFALWFEAAPGTVADKTAAIFFHLAKNARHPKWKGCGFLRTAAELANMPGHPAIAIGSEHKKKFERWLAGEYAAAGVSHPDFAARSIALVMDGVFSTMLIHRDPAYAEAAAETARLILTTMGR